jgi:L-lactate utilization protein LutC
MGGAMSDLLDRFTAALEAASGRLVAVADDAAARAFLDDEFADRRVVFAADRPTEDEVRRADVGVDTADRLLADTGTVVKTFPTRESSRPSLVPPVSVFLAKVADLVPGYGEAFEHLAASHSAGRAYSVLITGPSRTADIEKTLVIPAHGPRDLIVLITVDP